MMIGERARGERNDGIGWVSTATTSARGDFVFLWHHTIFEPFRTTHCHTECIENGVVTLDYGVK
jgi:hypothetical protein